MQMSTVARLIGSGFVTLILLFFFGLGCYIVSWPVIGISAACFGIWYFGFLLGDIELLVSIVKGNRNV